MNYRILFTALCAFACGHAFSADRPNILLILADDLGYGDLRCYNGQSKVATRLTPDLGDKQQSKESIR